MKRLTLIFLALTACGTPQEQCINRSTRDIRVIDRLIVETETNLKRGYALEEVTFFRHVWVRCGPPPPPPLEGQPPPQPQLCLDREPYTVEKPKAIDLAEEKRKLDSLQTKRRELEKAAAGAIADCKAQYPE